MEGPPALVVIPTARTWLRRHLLALAWTLFSVLGTTALGVPTNRAPLVDVLLFVVLGPDVALILWTQRRMDVAEKLEREHGYTTFSRGSGSRWIVDSRTGAVVRPPKP